MMNPRIKVDKKIFLFTVEILYLKVEYLKPG